MYKKLRAVKKFNSTKIALRFRLDLAALNAQNHPGGIGFTFHRAGNTRYSKKIKEIV